MQWKAVVGERLLFVEDGPATNAEIPSGGMVEGDFPKPTEVADVLAALDEPTRERLTSLVGTLQNTVTGHEQDLNATVQTAGPALAAVGSVLRGIGTDGPAIKNLVTDLNGTVDTLARRQQDVGAVIDELSTSARATAGEREQLRAALAKLPPTLRTAQGTLDKVPGVTDEALPLLEDLRPATEKLPGVSEQLAPLLADLRPLVADLKPTLEAASTLLDRTPGLLDSSHRSLPGLAELAGGYAPVLETLRPYTPEVTGFLTTWGSAGQNYDANGRYMRIFAQAGTAPPTVYPPGVTPPGIVPEVAPAPGRPTTPPATGTARRPRCSRSWATRAGRGRDDPRILPPADPGDRDRRDRGRHRCGGRHRELRGRPHPDHRVRRREPDPGRTAGQDQRGHGRRGRGAAVRPGAQGRPGPAAGGRPGHAGPHRRHRPGRPRVAAR
ncbi:hypothetical protein Ae168Ps1_3042c [Pseudonocardia sp. Ae168_Ps1]|nr:hypothetical protein Ae150APs1_3034c [Pseudonocardia sp. Ae150A_Ps1]OLL80636.1 hypothetical protein Ae168Ps1_3042c [Pseudonocardia sp. Ae168_Ps1]OLL85236.1 hypothetical protein Ae263Ps1_2291 [Pseudonocardia sp. Ae263_Ps1]OLL94739.1 hypothetical protein Ae356Ps1_4636c [Pseudonocardia sp. Ae356_Ps1]